ncbi:hypothetical protein D9M68_773690 [compost metagenome]
MDIDPGQILLQQGAGRDVPEPESIPDGRIHVFRRREIIFDQRDCLAHQGVLNPVGKKSRNIALDPDRFFSDCPHDCAHLLGRRCVRYRAANHFDGRHQMGWHKEMQPEHAVLCRQVFPDLADWKTR